MPKFTVEFTPTDQRSLEIPIARGLTPDGKEALFAVTAGGQVLIFHLDGQRYECRCDSFFKSAIPSIRRFENAQVHRDSDRPPGD